MFSWKSWLKLPDTEQKYFPIPIHNTTGKEGGDRSMFDNFLCIFLEREKNPKAL